MFEEKPVVLKILFRTDKNGSSWIDRSKISNPHIQKLFTQEEWKKFCDNVDFSLNPHEEPELKRATKKENRKDALKRLCTCLMWTSLMCSGIGCCLVLCVAGDNAGRADKHVVQPAQIRACMNVLDKESKKKSNVLLQLVIDGTIIGGGYIQHIKCTIMDSVKVVENFNDDV
ncbi:predicted protein [Chaetoceros tenuissimus]|uniref:Uncharacterized protein n=1 Tax=Chaetoceros tenuissimus TaxID=426638 RepID=A0AAD3D2K4_9STRA|nr:predicted protein [Chaetoceros tenuissimus]